MEDLSVTRKEFIEKYHLIKTKTKCYFHDGMIERCRTLYIDKYGRLFIFYNHDMNVVHPYTTYYEGMEAIDCRLGAGYNWYH